MEEQSMGPDRAKAAIRDQAITYARRVMRGQINDSAVHGLLQADAEAFADLPEIADGVFAHGLNVYQTMMASPSGEVK
jgi:hypothetical protein